MEIWPYPYNIGKKAWLGTSSSRTEQAKLGEYNTDRGVPGSGTTGSYSFQIHGASESIPQTVYYVFIAAWRVIFVASGLLPRCMFSYLLLSPLFVLFCNCAPLLRRDGWCCIFFASRTLGISNECYCNSDNYAFNLLPHCLSEKKGYAEIGPITGAAAAELRLFIKRFLRMIRKAKLQRNSSSTICWRSLTWQSRKYARCRPVTGLSFPWPY